MEASPNKAIPFEKHPLYQEAMQQIVAGDKEGAVASLKRLSEHYPDEQFLQDLLVRVQLQSTFGGGEYIPVDRSQGTPVLRTLVMVMLAVTTCLVVATGLVAVYNNWWKPIQIAQAQEEKNQAYWDDFEWRLAQGDLSGALEVLNQLSTDFPDDPSIQDALARVNFLKLCADMFADGVSLKERGDTQAAMDVLLQIPQECEERAAADATIEDLKKVNSWETAWFDAQNLLAAEDWLGAIRILTWIREQNPGHRRVQVEEALFQAHSLVARQLLDNARGDVEPVAQAIDHLQNAVAIKPGDQVLSDELRLAVGYVAGHKAYDAGNWSVAVVRWEPLYVMRPDYQDGSLRRKLFESYPLAARQLIAVANGSAMALTQAIDYLDQALIEDPENQELLEERALAVEYLAGLEAFVQGDPDLAISHWGPISVSRPDYQNGVLAEKLREACTLSMTPDEQYCKP